ncbi:hypothetical protein [Herbiconiux solani]|uniref:hypothetical protein n=1 Tax=Herbiconiux solani TaxID=661329 RepID=UPI000AAA0374|nr:hypothetical protein [Herbiconiux solani]
MRTDPPAGDELARMLATMRSSVMNAAVQDAPALVAARPKTSGSAVRRRALGIVFAVVGLVVIGGGGAALATGLIPNPFEAPPAPVVTVTVTPTPSPSPTPTPTPTAEPLPPAPVTPAAPVVDPLDPGTWVVDYGQVGSLKVGDPIAPFAEAAGLEPNPSPIDCPSGYYRIGTFDENSLDVSMALTQADARTDPVDDPMLTFARFSTRGVASSPLAGSPVTAAGIRLGSSEAELLAAYPDLQVGRSKYDDTQGYTTYTSGPVDGRYLVFQVTSSPDGTRNVRLMQTSTVDFAYDICD